LDLDFLLNKGYDMALELNLWEKAMGWRKRQMVEKQLEDNLYVSPSQRNLVIEEVAKEIEKMKVFGPDTISSFTIVIRNMKRELY
jgi:hypothetical protein